MQTVTFPKGWRLLECKKVPPKWDKFHVVLHNGPLKVWATGAEVEPIYTVARAARNARILDALISLGGYTVLALSAYTIWSLI